MSERPWTPGPWEAVISDRRGEMSWVRDPHMPSGADSIALVGASEIETEQANVQLIAAAPDLYEALRDIIGIARAATLHSGGGHNRKRIAKAEAALSRAGDRP